MTLTKNVNGIDVALNEEEIAEYNQMIVDFESKKITRNLTEFTQKLLTYLDLKASEKQYISAVSCISYSTSTNPQWAKEASAFIKWRDSMLAAAYDYQDNISNGNNTNSSFETFLVTAPVLIW